MKKIVFTLGLLLVALTGSADVRAEEIVARLIQASGQKGESDPKLKDLLPDLKKFRWTHFQQVGKANSTVKASGSDLLTLGERLKVELTYQGTEGNLLVVDVKLLLDGKTVLTQTAKLGKGHVCLGGSQGDNEAWIIDLQRR